MCDASDMPTNLLGLPAKDLEDLLCRFADRFMETPTRNNRVSARIVARVAVCHRNATVRNLATETLGHVATVADHQALVDRTSDHSWIVRASAYSALAKITRTRRAGDLWKGLSDNNPVVRRYAAVALADVMGQSIVQRFEELLSHERDPRARVGLLLGVARSGNPVAVEELRALTRHEDPWVSSPAAKALTEMRAGSA
jgi:HEAT repeat protein